MYKWQFVRSLRRISRKRGLCWCGNCGCGIFLVNVVAVLKASDLGLSLFEFLVLTHAKTEVSVLGSVFLFCRGDAAGAANEKTPKNKYKSCSSAVHDI